MLRKHLALALMFVSSIAVAGNLATIERSPAARPTQRAAVQPRRTRPAATRRVRPTGPKRTRVSSLRRRQRPQVRRNLATRVRVVVRKRPPRRVVLKPLDTRAQQKKILAEPLTRAPFVPDYVDIGMGPTGMMTMLSAIATGHTAVGVEMRGAPQRGVHQNIRVDWFHTLARIDDLMLERYGTAGIPKLPNGKPFILHDYFYNAERVGGHLDFPEIHGVGDVQNQNIAGRLTRISFEDARDATRKQNGGKAKLFLLPPPPVPEKADASQINTDMKVVLDSPSTFQAALINYELMLRAYINAMEVQDAAAGRPPRVKTYENHRVAIEDGLAAGYMDSSKRGKRRIVIEEVVNRRTNGRANRVRRPGTQRIDLGVPTRFSLTAGFGGGADAKTLGYEQEDVAYHDPATGQSVVAKQNWLVGEVTANVGGQLIRRISTITDPKTGKSQTVRQIAVGHESAPNVAWVPIQVPDFMTFDPIEAGEVPAGTDPASEKYAAAQKKLVMDYYVQQVSAVTHLPEKDIRKMRMFYGPSFFTLRERIGKTARLAANGNVAGDLMGNGHFLTSAGSMTGMIGHANRYIDYWESLNDGVAESRAAHALERGIKVDSEAWLRVSIKEFFDVSPVNFGAERAAAIGIKKDSTPITDAKEGVDHGLDRVLGQESWARSFDRLRRGEFGKAGVDFYVPPHEVDLTTSPDVTVHEVGAGAH